MDMYPVTKKKPCDVIIYTEKNRIEGITYLIGAPTYTVDNRLVDLMNYAEKRFIVVTGVKVFNIQGELLFETDFLILNKDFIVLTFEKEAMRSTA
ncbi:MAG: hypothetical protein ABIJ37_02190 [Pseudomonadota bacterium]